MNSKNTCNNRLLHGVSAGPKRCAVGGACESRGKSKEGIANGNLKIFLVPGDIPGGNENQSRAGRSLQASGREGRLAISPILGLPTIGVEFIKVSSITRLLVSGYPVMHYPGWPLFLLFTFTKCHKTPAF